MKSIDVFYQGEGVPEINHIEVDPEETFSAVKTLLVEKHGLDMNALIFLEDGDEPIDESVALHKYADSCGIKAHVHCCRHVAVTVNFNCDTVEHRFGPGTTVARVKRWAAKKLGMSPEEASEHVLQVSGTHERPAPGTHLGALVRGTKCRLSFDLVPDERING